MKFYRRGGAGSQEKVLMADFIAVIRRAVDGLSNNTPEMRARVYEKARAAVVRQLENMSPRPPEHMLQRQLDKLDAAIREVEAEHADALPALDETPSVSIPVASAAPAVAAAYAAPAWPDATPEPQVVEEAAAQEPVAPEVEETVEPVDAVEAPPTVTGDDWADAHMAEPAQPAEVEAFYADAGYAEPTVDEQQAPVVPAVEQEASWRGEPSFGQDEPEVDYARLYDSRAEEPAAASPVIEEPVSPPEYETEPTPAAEHEAIETVATFNEAPTAEETWSTAEADEPAQPAWDATAYIDPSPVAVEPAVRDEPEVAPDVPAVGVRVDSVEDWLQSRALDPQPTLPVATWDLPVATEAAANRVPELPEIAAGPEAVSYSPTDEFPAYEEPVRVESNRDFATPEGLSLPDADPAVIGSIAAMPAAASVDADDFSQWFKDHADEATVSARDSGSASAGQTPLAATEWDDHINSFAPSAKGAQVDIAGQSEGMEALVSGYGQQPAYRLEPKKRRNFAPVIVGALLLVLLGGGGYLAWSFRDDIGSMVANLSGEIAPAEQTAEAPAATPPAETEAPDTTPATPAAVTAPADGTATGQKFTQRLRADGTEIDDGAGSAPVSGEPAEGRSVSAQTVASTVEPTDPPVAANGAPATQTPGTAANSAPVAGGEKLFLYEERIGQATPVAVPGGITWTAVRENGPDGKPDPQIQGRINVPERGISALLTVKRNTDSSLPASHIIEVVFSVPADFEGGAIENLQRIAMKRTEQDRGDPLVAVTAKVTDDTYLVALNDFEDVVKRNMELLSTRGWIDIPITYRNGRRALITLDKGTTGGNVFQQVMREWAALAPAAPAN